LGRAEVEEIRGVQSAAVLRTLLDRELIEPVARGEGLGRPLLYGTTRRFLEHFGFRSLEDLPRPDELPVILRPVAPAPVMEEAAPFTTPAAPAEPSPLSLEAEAEAEALHLHVAPAREHEAGVPDQADAWPVEMAVEITVESMVASLDAPEPSANGEALESPVASADDAAGPGVEEATLRE
jgi:hypothetical protein